jgi:MATE family, multidrug efflux pump
MSKNKTNSYIFEDSPAKAILKLAWPMLIGMLAMTIFNLVDTWYIARLGTLELAAISYTFPVVMLLNGVTLSLGVGLTAVISNKSGEGNREEVKSYTRDGLILAMLVVITFMVAGLLTVEPLFRLMGASETILPLIVDYMKIWYFGAAAVVIPMVGNSAIRGMGDAKSPAAIMTFAAILNMILDPFLIYGIGPFPRLELEGAAIATVIARSCTTVASLYILGIRYKAIKLHLPKIRNMIKRWGRVLEIGAYATMIHLIVPISSFVLMNIVSGYGPEVVAAFGAGSRIEMFAAMALGSVSSAMLVYTGQHWGAKKYKRLNRGIIKSQQFVLTVGCVIYLLIQIFAVQIAGLFTMDVLVLEPLLLFMRLTLAGLVFEALASVAGPIYMGIRRPKYALLIFFIRFVVFMLPLAWIGGILGGVSGLFIGLGVGKILTGILGWFVLRNLKIEISSLK